MRHRTRIGLAALAFCFGCAPALADKYRNPVAVFAGLDKITGRIIAFEVQIDETVQFGGLQITPKVCYSRPVTERPQTTSFVEVDEVTFSNETRRIFNGWMFAGSPGLNAVEHPVYDVWLTGCKGATERDLIRTPPEPEEVVAIPPPQNPTARPIGPAGRPQLDPAERAAQERRRQQIDRSITEGPILPGQPLVTTPPPRAQAPQQPRPTQRFFPITGSGVGGQNQGILIDPAARN